MRALAASAALAVAVLIATVPPAHAEPSLRVIVHPSRADTIRRSQVRAIFLKQKLFWEDGRPIVAINLPAGSAARELFSERVFGQGSRRLASFWNRRYYDAGEFPPATLASEQAVIRFVAANPDAIAYVLAAELGTDVVVALILP
jgi:ABC-type phosphate transport system substrate-binding protein